VAREQLFTTAYTAPMSNLMGGDRVPYVLKPVMARASHHARAARAARAV